MRGRPCMSRHLTEMSLKSSGSMDSTFSAPEMSRTSSQTDASTISRLEDASCIVVGTKTPPKNETGGPFSSSPLSSPPPILFDPYENYNEATDSSSECSDDHDGDDSDDGEDTQTSELLSAHRSHTRLRNMKGRDLFDCNIWSDPLKTSVFYQFATTLRQKIREVEPTPTHHFIGRLRDIGKLTRVYTQNIDEIEKKIGLSTDLKVGAGNKRRKSAKQQQLVDEKTTGENPPPTKGEDDPGGKDASQRSSQSSEGGEAAKQRVFTPPEKGVECVFLHGSLHALRCFVCARLCDWDEDDREALTMSGEQPECPHCAGATAARQEKGKRALGIGKLRPDIVLYGEEHPQSDLISPIVQHDLSANPDLLLVLGTSLRVHGLKVMVREFAKAVHQKGGKVVFINFTKPSESTWGDVIDYWIEWDCDAWVDDLKGRKPVLWMSPEAIAEQEKLRREALAEKKRESLSNKRRAAIGGPEQVADSDQQPKAPPKPKEPAKNPQADRNDYHCGAYCMSRIAEAFYLIRGEPFDFFGYTPPVKAPLPNPPAEEVLVKPPVPRKPAVKERKLRLSAPAILAGAFTPTFKAEPSRRPAVKTDLLYQSISKDRFKKAATDLFNARRPQTPQSSAELRGPAVLPGPITGMFSQFQARRARVSEERSLVPETNKRKATAAAAAAVHQQEALSAPIGLGPAYMPSASVSAAVKTNPRIRKPTRKARASMPTVTTRSSTPNRAPGTPSRSSRQATRSEAANDQENVLAPFRVGKEELAGPRLATMEPVLNPSPPQSPLDKTPLASLSPNQRRFSLRHLQHPLMLSAPLIKLPYSARTEPTPSPSDQLLEEAAAVALSDMKMCR
jgi:NAD-dependent SIR2 family protein deacetylase